MAKKVDLLLGKIALEQGRLTRRQLDECIAIQEREQRETGVLRPLGEILVAQRVIDQATLDELVRLQQEKFREASEFSESQREDDIFGKLLVQRNLLPPEKVNECLRIQTQMAERGVRLRLGEVLVKKGYLSATQVHEVLLLQRKVIMTCPTCKKNYKVPGRKEGVIVRCPKCSTALKPADLSQMISAVSTTPPETASKASQTSPAKATTSFGRYDLLEELGEGGMGIVYKAWDKELRRVVALKMLKTTDDESDPQRVERFLREARSSARLRHPNIVQIYDIGTIDGKHYFTMDFIEGCSLHDLMSDSASEPDKGAEESESPSPATPKRFPDSAIGTIRPKRLALRKGLEILRDVAFALAHAHSHGIIHRDIKPANILVDSTGVPFLTDFGLAKDIKHLEKSGLTLDGQVIGTPFYLSPELAAGEKSKVGPASDIYSLGVIMYELLTGKKPYEADSFITLMWEIMHKEPPPPRKLSVRTHRDLETICLKALEKDPARRYGNAREFGEDIQRYLDGEVISARPAGRLYRAWRAARKYPAVSVGVVTLSFALAAAGGYFFYTLTKQRANARKNFLEGTALMEKGDWNAALDKLQAAFLLDPANTDIGARIEECKKRIAESGKIAADERRRAASLPYERAKAKVDRLDELARVGDFKKGAADIQSALAELEEAIAQDPSFAEPLFLKGRVLHLLGKQEDALQALEKAIDLNPTFAAPYLEKAAILLEQYTALVQPQVSTDIDFAHGDHRSQLHAPQLLTVQELDRERVADLKAAIQTTLRKVKELQVRPEEIHCANGVLLSLEGRAAEAIAELDKAISIYQYYSEAYRRRGFARLLLGEVKKALEDFNKAIEYSPFSLEAYIFRGNAYMMLSDYDSAVADYTRVLTIRPDFTKAIVNRGVSLIALGKIDEALADLDRAIALEPDNADAFSGRAFALLIRGDIAAALKDAEKAYALKPQEENNINILGVTVGLAGDLDRGIKLLSEGLVRYPASTKLLGNRASLYERKNDLERALADVEELCRLSPEHTAPILHKVRLLRAKNSLDEALATINAAIAQNDAVAELYEERAGIFASRQDFTRARADIEKALQLNPQHAGALVERARLRLREGDMAGAQADLDAAVRANPGRVETYLVRGELRKTQKDLRGAIEEYSAGLKEVPDNPKLLYERGFVRAEMGDFDAALADFTTIIRKNDRNVAAYIARARVNLEQGHFDRALLDVASALALDDKLAEGYRLRGECYRKMGNLVKAEMAYEKAIKLAPDDAIPYAGLGLVYMNDGRFEKAAECFKTFLRLAPNHPRATDIERLLAEAEKQRDRK